MHFHRAFYKEKPSISVKWPGLPWLFHRPGSLSSLCYAPPAQAYHASRLRRFRQTVFASSAILPAGCMGGLSLAAAFC